MPVFITKCVFSPSVLQFTRSGSFRELFEATLLAHLLTERLFRKS